MGAFSRARTNVLKYFVFAIFIQLCHAQPKSDDVQEQTDDTQPVQTDDTTQTQPLDDTVSGIDDGEGLESFQNVLTKVDEDVQEAKKTVVEVTDGTNGVKPRLDAETEANLAYISSMQSMGGDMKKLQEQADEIEVNADKEMKAFEGLRTNPALKGEQILEGDLHAGPDATSGPHVPKTSNKFHAMSDDDIKEAQETPGFCDKTSQVTIEQFCDEAKKASSGTQQTGIDFAVAEVASELCEDRKEEFKGNASAWCADQYAKDPVPHGGGCMADCKNGEGNNEVEMFIMGGGHDGSLKKVISPDKGCKDVPEIKAVFSDDDCCVDEETGNVCMAGKCDTLDYAKYQHCVNNKNEERTEVLRTLLAQGSLLQVSDFNAIKRHNAWGRVHEKVHRLSSSLQEYKEVLSHASSFLQPVLKPSAK